MRIVGGALSGRRISAPRGSSTRPTSERVREGIAGALEARGWIAQRVVLDLYCGSGAMAFEALSRGATSATLIDADRAALKTAELNAAALGLTPRVHVLALDLESARVIRALGTTRFDLVFVDPPYARIERAGSLLGALWEAGRLAANAVIVIEHARREAPTLPEGFGEVSTYRYGDTGVVLARAPEELPP